MTAERGAARIVRLDAMEYADAVPELAELFADVVADGGSLGFVSPFGPDDAAAWWRSRAAAVADGALTVWVALDDGGVRGTIALARADKPNARHRAEVVKLMVHPGARGRGLGRALLATAEEAAAEEGLGLLMLDTETDSSGERLYTAAGWTRYGVVPDYAADPEGTLRDCSFFWKRVG
ncbi:GNAT family N-acetyltransferase [Streptomyces radicis]|uniref:GNAT family N-acetyltransferase n=1 Tax=Streptomyces radicis TaxID=1750517 RepID=A0A3A9VV26_9ACTN|nr:GNAT family N-acetyltransferase [Streptomyces radicis]RKN04941.1 GNAT family N-acetyltransferase [Streptomyces radicis]RKN16356.1 GNAT family N-acetyltransferase [Streptomyces radicis]